MKAVVVEIANQFEPWDNLTSHDVPVEITIGDWLRGRHGEDFTQFERPTVCFYQGLPLLQCDWELTVIRSGDVVQFVTVAGNPLQIIIMVVVAVVSTVVALSFTTVPQVPGGQPAPDPVFTRQGQQNRIRPNEPIEVPYGRVRLWPSYAARSYNQFDANDQYQYNLFCLGQGYYDIEAIQLEDTPIANFQEVIYEVVEPGGELTLFPDNVVTTVEVGGLVLYAANEVEYEGPLGGFLCNPANTEATVIEIDVGYLSGLYYMKDGDIKTADSITLFEVRSVDLATGAALGPWVPLIPFALASTLFGPFATEQAYRDWLADALDGTTTPAFGTAGQHTDSARTITPTRFTRRFVVPKGRYEVRGARIDNRTLNSANRQTTTTWLAVRAFLPSTLSYGDVTMLAMKIRATNNVNDNNRSRINVIATRKLPWYDTGTSVWKDAPADLLATRCPVLAFCDIFRAEYGGQLADSFLDMDALMALKTTLDTRGDTFDWIYDQKQTLFSAAMAAARVARAIPMLTGSRVSMIRDAPRTVPVAVFTPDNMLEGSFSYGIAMPKFGDPDSLEVEYTDPVTWQQETVLCVLPGGTSDTPSALKFPGCTDRDRAYREGMYILSGSRYNRENFAFSTGMEGHLPTYGDLIVVCHDVLDLGTYGFVTAMNEVVLNTWEFTLSQAVTFEVGETYVLILVDKAGEASNQLLVTATAEPNVVSYTGALTETNYIFDDDREPPRFIFGTVTRLKRDCTVVSLTPASDNTVEIQCIPYDSRIHSFDTLDAPAIGAVSLPPVAPALPSVGTLSVADGLENQRHMTVTWSPVPAAVHYRVEVSTDNLTWIPFADVTVPIVDIPITPGVVWFRVAAVNLGQGPWSLWTGEVGIPKNVPLAVTAVSESWVSNYDVSRFQPWETDLFLTWEQTLGASDYTLRLYDSFGGTLLRTENLQETAFTYSYQKTTEDGGSLPSYYMELEAVNAKGASALISFTPANAAPAQVTGLQDTGGGDYTNLTWDAVADTDGILYEMWSVDYAATCAIQIAGEAVSIHMPSWGTSFKCRARDGWGSYGPWSSVVTIV